jgi:hypothetical protein
MAEGRLVGLTLHQWYTADEAVAAFGGDAASERSCDGQFVILPEAVLCLVTLGETTGEPHIPCPSCLVWRPRRLDYEPSDALPWLPEKVREVYDRGQKPIKKLRQQHVFLRTPSDERFIYAGPAHLGSYVSVPGNDVTELSADFSLNERLPREAWLKFGGYPGWLVEINHQRYRVDADDLTTFERLVNELPRQEFSHLCMTRYEEDSLTVHTNARRGWLMYLRYPADGGIYARDLEYEGDPRSEEVFECVCGIDLEFPAEQTLPRELAMRAAVEFFQTGELPRCVHWELE